MRSADAVSDVLLLLDCPFDAESVAVEEDEVAELVESVVDELEVEDEVDVLEPDASCPVDDVEEGLVTEDSLADSPSLEADCPV